MFPGPLQLKLSRWLKGDPVLLQKADLQKVVQVIHVPKANDIFFRYQGSYLLKQPIITHYELVDPSRQVIYISQMYISLCLVALISHLCKLAS